MNAGTSYTQFNVEIETAKKNIADAIRLYTNMLNAKKKIYTYLENLDRALWTSDNFRSDTFRSALFDQHGEFRAIGSRSALLAKQGDIVVELTKELFSLMEAPLPDIDLVDFEMPADQEMQVETFRDGDVTFVSINPNPNPNLDPPHLRDILRSAPCSCGGTLSRWVDLERIVEKCNKCNRESYCY
jgi:hypothetical protein